MQNASDTTSRHKNGPRECANTPEARTTAHKEATVDSTSVAETERQRRQRERLRAAFMDGAEAGMVELRGYGLTVSEREEAETLADGLYGAPEISEMAAAS